MPLAWSLHKARRDQIAGEVRRELVAGKRRDLIAAGRVGLAGGEAVLVGEHDQLVAGVQRGHRAAYVGLGGERAEDELTGDFGAGQPGGGQRYDLALAILTERSTTRYGAQMQASAVSACGGCGRVDRRIA
jgi:hypothetical protein